MDTKCPTCGPEAVVKATGKTTQCPGGHAGTGPGPNVRAGSGPKGRPGGSGSGLPVLLSARSFGASINATKTVDATIAHRGTDNNDRDYTTSESWAGAGSGQFKCRQK